MAMMVMVLEVFCTKFVYFRNITIRYKMGRRQKMKMFDLNSNEYSCQSNAPLMDFSLQNVYFEVIGECMAISCFFCPIPIINGTIWNVSFEHESGNHHRLAFLFSANNVLIASNFRNIRQMKAITAMVTIITQEAFLPLKKNDIF